MSFAPGAWITINIQGAKGDEKKYEGQADFERDRAAVVWWHFHHQAKRVPGHHHSDPRHDDIKNEQRRTRTAQLKPSVKIEQAPEPVWPILTEVAFQLALENTGEVVQRNDGHANRSD